MRGGKKGGREEGWEGRRGSGEKEGSQVDGYNWSNARSSFLSEFMTACFTPSSFLPFLFLTYFRVHDGVNMEVHKFTNPLCLIALHWIILVGKSLQRREMMKIELSARNLSALPNPEAILFSLSLLIHPPSLLSPAQSLSMK